MKCKDKFLVLSIVTFPGATIDDITPEMFTEESGNTVDEVRLQVVYESPFKPPSPLAHGSVTASASHNETVPSQKFSTSKLLEIDPPKLRFPFMMQAQREALPEMKCIDEFLVQSVVTFAGATRKNLTSDMFTEESGNSVDEVILQFLYVSPPTRPSLVPEASPRTSVSENRTAVSRKFSTDKLIEFDPPELRFPFKLKKQITLYGYPTKLMTHCLKLKTNYDVQPHTEIIFPRSACEVIVTMQVQRVAPPDMKCEDEFLIQSIATFARAGRKDITPEMLTEELSNTMDVVRLGVVYVSPPKSPSSVLEGSSPRASVSDNGTTTSNKISKFTEELGNTMNEVRVGVVHMSVPKSSSPFPEGFCGGSSPTASVLNNENAIPRV